MAFSFVNYQRQETEKENYNTREKCTLHIGPHERVQTKCEISRLPLVVAFLVLLRPELVSVQAEDQ